MLSKEYIFVPNDGTFERVLSAREAAAQPLLDDRERAEHVASILHNRNIETKVWLLQDGNAMIYGTREEAQRVSKIVEVLPSMLPSAQTLREQKAEAAITPHIAATFENAAARFRNVPVMRANFEAAASESRVVPFGKRPNIRGSFGQMEMAA